MADSLYAAICMAGCDKGNGYSGDVVYVTLAVDLRTKRAAHLQVPWCDDPPGKTRRFAKSR